MLFTRSSPRYRRPMIPQRHATARGDCIAHASVFGGPAPRRPARPPAPSRYRRGGSIPAASDGAGQGPRFMRVLVTGAGDYLGRRLLEALRRDLPADSRILGIDRTPQPPLDGVTFLVVDPFDADSLSEAVSAFDPTLVFHLAALASVAQSSETPSYAWRADLLGTLNLAEALAKSRATLVFLSATVVYGEAFQDRMRPDESVTPRPDTISGRTKTACEYILRDVLANAGVKHLVLRPSNYIGPRQAETFVVASFAGQIARIERGLGTAEPGGRRPFCRARLLRRGGFHRRLPARGGAYRRPARRRDLQRRIGHRDVGRGDPRRASAA